MTKAFDVSALEEKIDKTAAGATEIDMALGGVRFQSMMELMEFSKLMAVSGAAVPPHLRGNPGACLAICTRALRFGFDPFALAEHSFAMSKEVDVTKENEKGGRVTEKAKVDTIAYDSYVIRAVIEAHSPIDGRLRYSFEGEGDERTCTVSCTPKGGKDQISVTSPTLGKRKKDIGTSEKGYLKGSPLWNTKPDQQLAYDTARDLCRRHFPEVLMGWYDKDEFDEHAGTQQVIQPKPELASRLGKNKNRGFNEGNVKALEHNPGQTLDIPPKSDKEPVLAQTGGSAEPEQRQMPLAGGDAETEIASKKRAIAAADTKDDIEALVQAGSDFLKTAKRPDLLNELLTAQRDRFRQLKIEA